MDFRPPGTLAEVASVQDATVAGAEGPLPARVYRPAGDGPFPTVVLLHGGGFVIGDLDTHAAMARSIAAGAQAVVVAVDYRLAPEAKFPAAAEDAIAAVRDVQSRLAEYGGNDVLAVAGDSAGGNLSAVAAQHVPGIAAQPARLPGDRRARGVHLARGERHRLLPRPAHPDLVHRPLRRHRLGPRRPQDLAAARRPRRAAACGRRHRPVRPAPRRGHRLRRRARRRRRAGAPDDVPGADPRFLRHGAVVEGLPAGDRRDDRALRRACCTEPQAPPAWLGRTQAASRPSTRLSRPKASHEPRHIERLDDLAVGVVDPHPLPEAVVDAVVVQGVALGVLGSEAGALVERPGGAPVGDCLVEALLDLLPVPLGTPVLAEQAAVDLRDPQPRRLELAQAEGAVLVDAHRQRGRRRADAGHQLAPHVEDRVLALGDLQEHQDSLR
ncbi:alpha/beta hydrolase fold domain-containing protein [Nocardioides convexus]|uniref:alpha/beta hydrolase fold domain-containing protein n=1 Tax=Nocardioides convexus TaxID=2712224 RepID=UPI0024185C92|nr:alpha/beta hydrolase fold domain-containing protein [Nocardioides convexus]